MGAEREKEGNFCPHCGSPEYAGHTPDCVLGTKKEKLEKESEKAKQVKTFLEQGDQKLKEKTEIYNWEMRQRFWKKIQMLAIGAIGAFCIGMGIYEGIKKAEEQTVKPEKTQAEILTKEEQKKLEKTEKEELPFKATPKGAGIDIGIDGLHIDFEGNIESDFNE